METYCIIVSVDEETVKLNAETDNVIDAIKNEMGWVTSSGIYVREITKKID